MTTTKMDKERARGLLSDYLDGELSPSEEQALLQAVADDDELRAELEALKQTLNSLSVLGGGDAVDLAPKVERTINRRSRGRFFGPDHMAFRIPFEWISFLIIIALLMIYLTLIQGGQQQVTPDKRSGSASSQPAKQAGDQRKRGPGLP